MYKACVFFLILTAPVLLTSCDNDDGVTPEPFTLTIEVVDDAGAPVTGLSMSVAADIPYYQDKASPPKPAVTIPFTVAQACSVRLVIEDVAGDDIRLLGSQPVPMGWHHWVWDGLDDAGIHLHSGLYRVRMMAYDLETTYRLHQERVPMYMGLIDPDRVGGGTTDADGKIELTNKRLFPHLYNAPDIPATNENGEQIGTIEFTNSMRFGFHDPVGDVYRHFYADVTGSGALQFVWTAKTVSESPAQITPVLIGEDDPVTPVEFDLSAPFPCPFN